MEEKDLELEDDLDLEEKVEDKSLQTEIAKKKHWREKYQKVGSELEEAKKKLAEYEAKKTEEKTPSSVTTTSTPDEIEVVLNLRSLGKTDGEILKLRQYARMMNRPISEVMEDPLINAGLEAERQKAKVEEATPNPSAGTFTVQGKTWAQMTTDERKANYDSFINGKGSNSNI